MNSIKSIFNDNKINIKSRRILFKDISIYKFYDKKVIIEKLNEILFFIPKYKILLENPIENYINELKCDLNNPRL